MKYFWILLLFFSLQSWKAQTDTLKLYQIYNSFSNEEKAEWTSFENNWNYFEFTELKKKFKIKGLNCKNCETLFADLYLKIDENGKVVSAQFLKGKKCGIPCDDQEFKNWFEQSLKKQSFRSVKNKVFIARFGHGLKC